MVAPYGIGRLVPGANNMNKYNKILLFVGLLAAVILCIAAQPARTVHKGIFQFESDGDRPFLMHRDSGGGIVYRATQESADLFTVDTDGAVWANGGFVGAFVGNGASLTNLTATNGLWLTVNDARAVTNKAGDLTLEAASTFLQMSATGSGSGYQYYDFFNGGSQFIMRRKANGGASVLATIFTLTNDVWTFGVPVSGTFSGDGSALTGIADTNFNAGLYAASTNASIVNSLAVTGMTGDGVRLAVRATNGQTNDVFAVQDNNNIRQFGVRSGGGLVWNNAPTNDLANTNSVIWMIVTNAGVGYLMPLYAIPVP